MQGFVPPSDNRKGALKRSFEDKPPDPEVLPEDDVGSCDKRHKKTTTLTVLVTSLHGKGEPAGVSSRAKASFKILTRASDGKWIDVFEGTGAIPFRCDVTGLVEGGYYWIQPLTPNTQAKILPTSLAPIS